MNNSLATLTLQTPEMAQANLERKNQIAIQHGLPAKGTRFRNRYGAEWVVDGHLFAPDFTSFARNGGDIKPKDISEADPRDLMPAVVPMNWSRRLEEFYFLINRCTSKHLMFLDTMPDLRPHQAKRDSHYVSFASDPARFLIHLDVDRAHETIIAHELGHLWLALVEECEDLRDLPADPHNIGKRFQFDYVNSFVTDQRVNEIIAERGFDVTFINEQQREALILFSLAVEKGHRPDKIREAAFMALPIASVLLEKAKGSPYSRRRPDPNLDEALNVLKNGLPDVWVLAERLADTVWQHGYSNSQSIRRSVEECLKLSFQFTGDDFDPARDLREGQITEPNFDKWPQMLPGMPVEGKLEIGKLMAKHNLGAGGCRLSYTPLGQVQIEFVDEGGQVTSPIVLKHTHHIPGAPLPLPLDLLVPQPMKKPPIPVLPRAPQMPQMPQLHGAKAPVVPRLPNGQTIPGLPAIPGVTVPFPHEVSAIHTKTPSPFHPQPLPPQPFHPQPPHPHRRDYLPGLALSLAKERLGLEGDNHLYRYVNNNPVNAVDPSGLQAYGVFDENFATAMRNGADEALRSSGWDNNIRILADWIGESGPTQRWYSPNSFQTRQMRESPGATQMRAAYSAGGCKNTTGFFSTIDGAKGLRKITNGTQVQVGGFKWRATYVGNGRVTYRIYNQLSIDSFFYHGFYVLPLPHKPRGKGIRMMGNINQYFQWTEQSPCGCENW